MYDVVRRTAEQVFIPLTVGGGVRSTADVDALLRAGADKVSLNTAAIARPELLAEAARQFGSQCVVLSVDARRVKPGSPPTPSGFEVTTHGGRAGTGIDAVEWARRATEPGRGRDPAQLDGRRRHRGRLRPGADRPGPRRRHRPGHRQRRRRRPRRTSPPRSTPARTRCSRRASSTSARCASARSRTPCARPATRSASSTVLRGDDPPAPPGMEGLRPSIASPREDAAKSGAASPARAVAGVRALWLLSAAGAAGN